MLYEWDEKKNRANQRKHDGISFEMAALAFEDERCVIGFNCIDEQGEERWHAIGEACPELGNFAVLLVVHAYRENIDGEEIIRIISARRTEKHELRWYQEQALD